MKNGSVEKISVGTPEKKEKVSQKSSEKKVTKIEILSEKSPSPVKKQKIEERQSQGMEIETKFLLPKFKQKPLSLSSSCNNSSSVKQKLELGSNNGEFSFNGPNGDFSQKSKTKTLKITPEKKPQQTIELSESSSDHKHHI
jgi:hypothetical protein